MPPRKRYIPPGRFDYKLGLSELKLLKPQSSRSRLHEFARSIVESKDYASRLAFNLDNGIPTGIVPNPSNYGGESFQTGTEKEPRIIVTSWADMKNIKCDIFDKFVLRELFLHLLVHLQIYENYFLTKKSFNEVVQSSRNWSKSTLCEQFQYYIGQVN